MVPKIRFTTYAFGARGCAHPHPGGRARRARRVRAPPPRAGRRAPNALPNSLPPSSPPAARAPSRARAGVASPPKRTSVSFPPRRTPADPVSSPNLLDVSFAFAPVRLSPLPTLARPSSRPRPPFLRYSLPTCQQPAHRVRATPRPHACTPLPIAPPSLETAPQYSGRAAAARNRAAGSTPAARTPPTHTGCLASPKRAGVSFPPRRPSPNLGLRL